MHQDTAFVVVESPLELAACWGSPSRMCRRAGANSCPTRAAIACRSTTYSGRYKHSNPERDGHEQHGEWATLIHENAERLGLPHRTFLPKKGDLLIWSADLAHGGSPVVDENLTRRSLVGHWCPARCRPHYFEYRPDRRGTIDYGRGRYSSA